MKFLKVSCSSCPHYQKCSATTKLYVNYCGADFKRVEQKIHNATDDCRNKRGLLISHSIISTLPVMKHLQEILAPVPS